MNSKMLHPKEVVEAVIEYWRAHQNEIDISQVEGFVRQSKLLVGANICAVCIGWKCPLTKVKMN